MSLIGATARHASPRPFGRGFRLTLHWRRLTMGIADALRRVREMNMLLAADDRMLKDIGLTRSDARALAHCRRMAHAAAKRRDDAMASAAVRRGVRR